MLLYNTQRPHEALGQKTPMSLYQPAPRCYPERLEEPVYEAEQAVRRVRSNGQIKWAGEVIFVGEALVGEPVGVSETESGDWLVRFANVDLGYIDLAHRRLRPAPLRTARPVDLMDSAAALPTTPQAPQQQPAR